MENITAKSKEMIEILLREKEGPLYFFGYIERIDKNKKFDLLISADWIKERNNQKDLEFIINNLKIVFDGKYEFIENIVLFKEDEEFLLYLKRENSSKTLVLDTNQRVQIWEDAYVDLIPLYVDFKNHPPELLEEERKYYKSEPVTAEDF